jgi:peptidoglycan/xylan/chitin deacetylase (PgdA/CDA1 family)
MYRLIRIVAWRLATLVALCASTVVAAEPNEGHVSILAYHRFGPTVADSMTVRTVVFEQHLAWLKANGYEIVPLKTVRDRLKAGSPPAENPAVVITADDGHRSVYFELFPLILKYHFPVTLFIYPSAISNASYALTWEQLAEMKRSGLVDIESHTFWHPNFRQEKKRLDPTAYRSFVDKQLRQSKTVLETKLDIHVDMLAWPFGIYDPDLEQMARDAGYAAAFSIDRGPVRQGQDIMSLPRYLMEDADQGARFAMIVGGRAR